MTAESDATGVALEAALGSVRIGVLTVDLDGYVRSSSPGLDRMFEAPVVVGTHVTELAPEEDADRIASVLSALADEGTDPDSLKRLRFGARKASGRTFPVMVNVERIEGSDLSVAVVRDLSQLLEAQDRALSAERRSQSVLVQLVQGLSTAVEFRDPYTAGHQHRVADIALAIADTLGWDDESGMWQGLFLGCLIHDIGKLYGPSSILNRPGRLSGLEMGLIREHPVTGYQTIEHVDFGVPVAAVVRQHHERLDGSGSPDHLSGGEVQPCVRIAAVADVLEAMTSHRPYRPAKPVDAALAELVAGRGSRYDGEAVDAVVLLLDGAAPASAEALLPLIPAQAGQDYAAQGPFADRNRDAVPEPRARQEQPQQPTSTDSGP